jgi:tRNA(Ile)-lysidine synthase
LIKNRDTLVLVPTPNGTNTDAFYIDEGVQEVKIPLNLSISKVSTRSTSSNTTIFVDKNKLFFPLVIKSEGDSFQPFGMNGKLKKLSKLFKDEKLSVVDKENIWVLWSAKKYRLGNRTRQDERFKIENNTENILKLEVQ